MRKAMIWAAGLLLAATLTGCGGKDSEEPSVATGDGGGTTAASTFDGPKFSKCMRDQGMDWFPDMASADQKVTAPDDVDDSKIKAAVEACKEWAPPAASSTGPRAGPGREVGLKYAQCMRENGIPDFPDPNADGNFNLGPDGDSPKYEAAGKICRSKTE
jgi:hypothetical protein